MYKRTLALLAAGVAGTLCATSSNAQVMARSIGDVGRISPKLSPLAPGMRLKPQPSGIQAVQKVKLHGAHLAAARQTVKARTKGWFGKAARTDRAGANPMADILGVQAFSEGSGRSLVLYDSSGPYGFVGDVFARQLAAMLSHVDQNVLVQPVESYQAGQMAGFDQTFYLGVLYDNPLPATFKAEAVSTTKPLCWLGYNLWQVAWKADWSGDNATFVNKYGIRFNYIEDGTAFPQVNYKNTLLDNNPWSGGLGRVQVANSTKATVLARAKATNGTTMPYVTKAANLWYVAENPLQDSSTWTTTDRSLVFADILHDIVGSTAPVQRNAFLRIEDVHSESDTTQLRAIADVLGARNVPFVVCVIPEYQDPLGYWHNGTPVSGPMTENPDFVSALHYMESKGGQVIMHGLTHQYNEEHNPGSGVSGDDYEFFRMVDTGGGNVVPYGPVWEDSPEWVNGRLDRGLELLNDAGFYPNGWNTPHYLASPVDYQAFADRFDFSTCRGKFFSLDAAGYLYWVEMANPYPVVDDLGMIRLPDTLGYVSTPELGTVGALPTDLVNKSKKIKVVRDGWAGGFFHWFLPTSMLVQLVDGIKGQGYTFRRTVTGTSQFME